MGRPEFEQMVASAPRISLQTTDLSNSAVAVKNTLESFDLYAPAGCIGILQSAKLYVDPPTGATTGYHQFYVSTTALFGGFVLGQSNFGVPLEWNRKYWRQADKVKEPPSDAAQVNAFNNNYFDSVNGLTIGYNDWTDVDQDKPRTIQITWIQQQLGV